MSSHALSQYRSVAKQDPISEIVARHAELVRRIAFHIAGRLPSSVDVGDLIQAGMIGLMEAARQYNSGHGASFTTYASIRIRGAIIDEIRKGDWVPRSVHRASRSAAAATREIEQRTGRAATPQQVADALGISVDEYQRVLEDASRGRLMSLDEHIEENGEARTVAAEPPAERELERDEFLQELATAIDSLPEREKLLLSLYYEQELNMREIGAVLGVSESRVCQLHGQAMVRLRARLSDWQSDDIND